MGDIEVGFSFEKAPDLLEVKGKKETLDESGGVIGGMQYYWGRADQRNIESKRRTRGFEICRDPEVTGTFTNSKAGETQVLRAGPDELVLMHRPAELLMKEREMIKTRKRASIEESNTLETRGVRASFSMDKKKGGVNGPPAGYIKKGR